MKPLQKPIRANQKRSNDKRDSTSRSPQTVLILQYSESILKSIDWKGMIKTNSNSILKGITVSFLMIKSLVTPVWQSLKRHVIDFSRPYYVRVKNQFEKWTNLFYSEMDDFILLENDTSPRQSQTESEMNLQTNSLVDSFLAAPIISVSGIFIELKKQMFRNLEKSLVAIESMIRNRQSREFNQVVFEVVNYDQLELVPVSTKRGSRKVNSSNNYFLPMQPLNLNALFNFLPEEWKYLEDRIIEKVNQFADTALHLTNRFFYKRFCKLNVVTETMFSPPINKSGLSFMANNPGYP